MDSRPRLAVAAHPEISRLDRVGISTFQRRTSGDRHERTSLLLPVSPCVLQLCAGSGKEGERECVHGMTSGRGFAVLLGLCGADGWSCTTVTSLATRHPDCWTTSAWGGQGVKVGVGVEPGPVRVIAREPILPRPDR